MERVISPTSRIAPPAVDHRIAVRSFEVDGPATLVDRFVALGTQPEHVVRHRLSSSFGWYRTGRARHFVASVAGRDVGRCSAMIDPAQHDEAGAQVGLVGQWWCEGGEDGLAAAHALLDLACSWLREQGARDMVGPIDFSTWYGYRFLDDDGDGRDPVLTEPASAPHAIAQWESFGFERDETYFSAEIASPVDTLAMAQPVAKALLDEGWCVRQLRMREWDDLIDMVHAMSMEEFVRQPYFTPIELDDLRAAYESIKHGIDPRYVFTAWSPQGEFAGYVLGVRDLARATRALGMDGLRGRLRAAWEAWRADTMLVKTICVARPYRRIGVTILLQHALYRAAMDTGHTRVCNMLMHATNRSRELTAIAGGVEFRSYATLRLAHDRH